MNGSDLFDDQEVSMWSYTPLNGCYKNKDAIINAFFQDGRRQDGSGFSHFFSLEVTQPPSCASHRRLSNHY